MRLQWIDTSSEIDNYSVLVKDFEENNFCQTIVVLNGKRVVNSVKVNYNIVLLKLCLHLRHNTFCGSPRLIFEDAAYADVDSVM